MSTSGDEDTPGAVAVDDGSGEIEAEAGTMAEAKKPPPARGMKKVAGIKSKLAHLTDAREKKEALLAKLHKKAQEKALSKRDADAKQKYINWLASNAKTITELNAELEEAEAAAAEAAALLAGKEAAKKEAAEQKRELSDLGAVTLVELCLGKYGKAFDNNSDSVAKVWEHVHLTSDMH
jgi:DNA repair exonuclease SbcCD ATPase subunit